MPVNPISVTRKTTESEMYVKIDISALSPDYRKKINTPYPFLSHMLEHIAWRSGANLEISVKLAEFTLSHVVVEDLGMTIGKAFREYVLKNKAEGSKGYGDGIGIIDEAKCDCAISFEERAYFNMASNVTIPDFAEGIPSEDLVTFLEGFAQGANATVHLDVQKGVNAHHIWEAAFRAFGIALGRAIYLDNNRLNMSSGVAGTICYDIKTGENA